MASKLFLYVGIAADVCISITKFIAASITGSSAMVSEGVHSLIDTINQLLLLMGIKKSKKKPDARRPFGYGREIYFWSFIVSLLLFSIGGCISFYEGILRFKRPGVAEDQNWNYIVLAISFVFTAISATVSFKKFSKQSAELSFYSAIKQSKDPAVLIVMLSDLGDLIGLLIAFFGIYLGHRFQNHYYDGIASMLIGIFLIIISLLLVRESGSLLMGEAISKKTLRKIIALTETDPAIEKVKFQFSMYLAPEEVVLQLIATFKKEMNTQQITEAIQRIIMSIQEKFPRIKQIFIEPG
ncbi:MAG TPA: cation diffusion facilitator family transporter [Hanamia sp.]